MTEEKPEEKKKPKETFTDSEVDKIKSIIESKDLVSDDEKEKLKPLLSSSIGDDVALAVLFARCFSNLNMVGSSLFEADESKDFRSKIEKYLDWYRENVGADNVNHFSQELQRTGGGLGTSHFKGKLQTRTTMHKKDYVEFIQFFSKVAELEE